MVSGVGWGGLFVCLCASVFELIPLKVTSDSHYTPTRSNIPQFLQPPTGAAPSQRSTKQPPFVRVLPLICVCVCEGRINKVCAYTSIGVQADLRHSGGPVMMPRGRVLHLDSDKNIHIFFSWEKKADLVYLSFFFLRLLLLPPTCRTSLDRRRCRRGVPLFIQKVKKKEKKQCNSESRACLCDARVVLLLLLPFISMWRELRTAVNHL